VLGAGGGYKEQKKEDHERGHGDLRWDRGQYCGLGGRE